MFWPEASTDTHCGLIISFPATSSALLRIDIALHGVQLLQIIALDCYQDYCLKNCLPRAMASSLPIPVPPRTPTPPPDDPPEVPQPSSYDQSSSRLSPLTDTFPAQLSPLDAGSQDRLSPTKSSFGPSPVEADSAQNGSNDDGSGPFNFKTVTMAKSPMIKSVS